MDLYPKFAIRRPYLGETRVRRLLEAAQIPHSFAIHSVNLAEHDYKRWAEIDFLLVCPNGLAAIEVKGGTVSFVDRVWRYANGRGQQIESIESPATQAQSAARALERQIARDLRLDIGSCWGVAFPLTNFRRDLPDLPINRLADLSICQTEKTFEKWLLELFNIQRRVTPLDSDTLEALREYLIPKFSASISTGLAIGAISTRIGELTNQQAEILNGLNENPRLFVTGGAGTGKTELALLAARAEALEDRKTALITTGHSLAARLTQRLAGTGVDVVEGVPSKTYDTLIVDEGQDYAFPEVLERLSECLRRGLSNGRWRWFMDSNLQFFERPPDPGCIERLETLGTVFRLQRNVRTTREVVGTVQAILRADVGVSEIDGFGIPVTFRKAEGADEQAETAASTIRSLIDDGILPADIAILGPRGVAGAVGSKLQRKFPDLVQVFGIDSGSGHTNRAELAKIREFRGLEAVACILIDLDELPNGYYGNSLLYVGMTRASASLTLVLTDNSSERLGRLAVDSIGGANAHGPAA